MFTSSPASKGKQATKGQKQIYEENQSTLKYYLIMSLFSSVLFAVSVHTFVSVGSYAWVSSLFMMYKMAAAKKNEKGVVIDAGMDLNMEGAFGEYCKDVIILVSAVQIMALFWSKFWFLLLLIPSFAAYKLWTGLLAPYFFAPAPDDSETMDKKAMKRERKMRRMQQ